MTQNNNSAKPLQNMDSLQYIAESKKINNSQPEAQEPKQVWFYQLFRFATTFDYILMIIGSIAAMAMGTAFPAFAYIWGNMTDSFGTVDGMVDKSRQTMLIFIYVGIGGFFAGWLMFACWMITGQRQAIACRKAYLHSLLKQQIGWFDIINQTQLASKFATDTFAFQGAIGEKISTLIMTIATLIAGFVFAFVTGWLMTLVMLATIPALGIAGYFYIRVIGEKDNQQQKSYAAAGGRAEQAIAAIKTVKQLNGEEFQCVEYQKCLEKASQNSFKFALFSGMGIASIFFVMIASYSLGFWYGSKCILGNQNCPSSVSKQTYTAGSVLVVFFSIVMGGFNLSQLTPAFKKIIQGRQAAARIFTVIDREPLIKNPPNGVKIDNLKGKIRFQDVTFSYPKDKMIKVFDNLTMDFDINKTGLVGQSGCGKSTTLQLIMRFYDPDQGRITVDGHDLKTLDLIWWRQQIGYVGQQPVLFATSIKQNLLFGNQKATDQQINQALKMAEAYNFVQSLDQKLQTYVGYGGGQLSGGQKQRIAIARAILRKPKIMLLDQATSALDRRNERLIQSTLQKVTSGITTITVAHRVKTIMNSDIIYVFQKGGIAQRGKFNELNMFKNYKQEQEMQNKEQIKQDEGMKNLQDIQFIKRYNKEKQSLKEQQDLVMTKQQKQKRAQKQLVDKYDKAIFSRIFAYSKDKLPNFIVGIIAALASGVVFPIFSIFLSKMLASLLVISIDPLNQKQIDNINLYALIFLILAICSFISSTIQITSFGIVGEYITRKIRIQTFNKILRMPVPWFDVPKNNAGTLTARLSTDCQLVNTVTTTTVSILIQNLSTLLSGIIIAFVHQWRTSLVALGLLPLMIISGAIQMAFNTGFSDQTDAAYKDSSNLIMEAMINIRTVSSFGYQGIVAKKYDQKMQQPYRLAIKKGNASGFFFGLSQIIMFTIFGVLFFLGAIFVRDNPGVVTVQKMFTAIYAIMFAGMTAGNNAHFMPDTAACKNSAANLFQIQDRQDQDQMQIQQNSKLLKSNINGDIVLTDVDFKYESRNEYVFKNMNLKVKKGNKVAFVGTSGCGKSTIIQLLQRFYYLTKGTITINGIDIKDYDIHYLRSCFGVVSQEPVLFNGSFADNIRYNKTQVTMAEIQSAAKKANAISFIMGSQETNHQLVQNDKQNKAGFDRSVGVRGSHISGGQKQRVAIARTILRNPQMLLLDQATSALDRANQKKVQDSLDSIMHGKTVISIAHRIQTIKNSDEIYMFQKGKIVESGSYNELIAKQGHFYNLERGTSFT